MHAERRKGVIEKMTTSNECKYCRELITIEDAYRMARYGEPHCHKEECYGDNQE